MTSQTTVVNPCYTDFFDNCNYYDQQSLNNFLSAQTETLFIMHFNIRSLQKHSDHLASYLSELSVLPDIIAITETKLTNGIIKSNIHLTGYAFLHCDSSTKAGGVGLYIKETFIFKQKPDISIALPFVEDMWIEVQTEKGPAVVGVVYRHPTNLTSDYEEFSARLYDIFSRLNSKHCPFYAVGDYNIDLTSVQSNNNVRKYVNNMISSPCKCAIDLPTRITDHSKTLLDHIYVNDNKHSYTVVGSN